MFPIRLTYCRMCRLNQEGVGGGVLADCPSLDQDRIFSKVTVTGSFHLVVKMTLGIIAAEGLEWWLSHHLY